MQPAGVVALVERLRVGLAAAVEEVEGEPDAVEEVQQM
jgi:hypothetical protein